MIEWTKERDELETDFTGGLKSCHPPCTEQYPVFRPKNFTDDLIDNDLQYQSKDIKNLIKQFNFWYTNLEDEELVTLIDKVIDSRNVYSEHKFDIGQTSQKFQVTLKTSSELRKQRPSNWPFTLQKNWKNYLDNSKILVSFEKWEMMMSWDHFLLIQSYYSQKNIILNLSTMLYI